jgi:glycosyltransferase involved in cell wall biosynthesis
MMTKQYKVSVIVPARDTTQYLKKCLDSLLAQTIGSIEVIVIDDGSQPSLFPVIAEYRKSSNLVYLRNEIAVGPGAARNMGLTIAKGEFIGFCDSDDWVDLDLYESAVKFIETHNADIGVLSSIREFAHVSNETYYICYFDKPYMLSRETAIHILSGVYNMGIKLHNACWNKLFRAEFLCENKIYFEEGIYFQGILFNIRSFLQAKNIVCIPRCAYHHYKRANSIVQSFNGKHIKDFGESYLRMKSYFEEADIFEQYRNDFYSLCDEYMNLVVKEIFEFIPHETQRKQYLRQLLNTYSALVSVDEYFEYASAEQIRRHIQPHIQDTTLD